MRFRKKSVLITCGPTCVPIDDMRVLSNRSTGKLGHALAERLSARGARVAVLEGPVAPPLETRRVRVEKFYFFDELRQLLKKELKKNFDAVLHLAAVSDYAPEKKRRGKLPSGQKTLTLTLRPTEKLILMIKKYRPEACLIGFKLEPAAPLKKLLGKGARLMRDAHCDFVVVNTLSKQYQGFIMDKNQRVLHQAHSRAEMAAAIIQTLETVL